MPTITRELTTMLDRTNLLVALIAGAVLAILIIVAVPPSGAGAAARPHATAPVFLFRSLDTPRAVLREARRIAAGMSTYAAGDAIDRASVLGCANRPGRLPWRCLIRLEYAGAHCDVVAAIGHEPLEVRAHGRVIRTEYLPTWTAQRFRVVWGPCTL